MVHMRNIQPWYFFHFALHAWIMGFISFQMLSFTASCSVEEVAASCDAVRFFQLYVIRTPWALFFFFLKRNLVSFNFLSDNILRSTLFCSATETTFSIFTFSMTLISAIRIQLRQLCCGTNMHMNLGTKL